MDPQKLQGGAAYYRLTFADMARTVPAVEPMYFVGTNIAADDDPALVTYYFQDTVSYTWRGAVTDPAHRSKHPEIDIAVFPHTEAEVQSAIYTLAAIVVAVSEAQERAVREG